MKTKRRMASTVSNHDSGHPETSADEPWPNGEPEPRDSPHEEDAGDPEKENKN